MTENKENKNNGKKNQVARPHDTTFKKLFGQVKIAKEVIEKNLPEEITEDIDFNTMEKLDGSFISEKLKETFTDIIYGVRVKNKDHYY